jgi:agmatine deiminase
MAFGASEKVWGKRLLGRVQADLALIARTIRRFEPVSMLVRPEDSSAARRLVGTATVLIETDLDDLWIRDTGPSFVVGKGRRLGGVDLNFNGWGNKQTHDHDAEVAAFIAEKSGAEHLTTELIGEGAESRWTDRVRRSSLKAAFSTRIEIQVSPSATVRKC